MTVHSVSNYFYPIEKSFKPTAGIFFEIVPGKRLKNYMISVDLTYQHASHPKWIEYKFLNLNPIMKFYPNKTGRGFFWLTGMFLNYLIEGQDQPPGSSIGGSLGIGYQLKDLSFQTSFNMMPTKMRYHYISLTGKLKLF